MAFTALTTFEVCRGQWRSKNFDAPPQKFFRRPCALEDEENCQWARIARPKISIFWGEKQIKCRFFAQFLNIPLYFFLQERSSGIPFGSAQPRDCGVSWGAWTGTGHGFVSPHTFCLLIRQGISHRQARRHITLSSLHSFSSSDITSKKKKGHKGRPQRGSISLFVTCTLTEVFLSIEAG